MVAGVAAAMMMDVESLVVLDLVLEVALAAAGRAHYQPGLAGTTSTSSSGSSSATTAAASLSLVVLASLFSPPHGARRIIRSRNRQDDVERRPMYAGIYYY